MDKKSDIIERLSPLERKIIPFLHHPIEKIVKDSELDETSVIKALRFLESKGVLSLSTAVKKKVILGTNGIYYKKNHLPERNLLHLLETHNHLSFDEAKKMSKLSDNEFKVSLGALKNKRFIVIANGKISLNIPKEELVKKTPEEQLLEELPMPLENLNKEQREILEVLKQRKDLVEIAEENTVSFKLTSLGDQLAGKEITLNLIEEITPEVIKTWSKNKKVRKYDIDASVPRIYAGKRHFVNQTLERARKIWVEMGFKEMEGNIAETSFWVFDALFTPQDHPAREMQDTFFIKVPPGKIKDREHLKPVKESHENGMGISKGWQYSWNEDIAKRVVLRTHTTSLSARTIASLKENDLPAKFFAIGKCFRNETVDWNHAFEFYQTEGIVVDKNVTFVNLLGYLQVFYKKMGFDKIRFRPSFFAYTEPSVEIDVFHPARKEWIELGGAGIFRPEVTLALLGKVTPVLAWGQGLDRIIRDVHKIKDIREMYSNDIQDIRDKKVSI
ncbi:phenylalanine--tRNA ligase subunit alpha [Candidatus Pacearchaeota archaeon]|nr:phenylalanine--tRNA ligase subunit alpha [Candidatus Pacearchaeota archaeon]